MFDDLLGRDLKTMKPVPRLAESVKPVDDLTWELALRRGVKFHNGEPFTAESVKFSLERIVNPEQKSPIRSNFTWLKRVDIVDDSTVRLVTHKPYPLISELLAFGNAQMLPPKYAKQVGDAGLAKNPVGTGPYKFVEWKKGQHLILEANPDYWGGAPAVKTIVFRTIPETATQIAELLTGGVDILRALPPDQIPVVEGGGNARVSTAKTLRVVFLRPDVIGRASKTPLADLRVRRALNHGVDVDEIIKNILAGRAYRTPSWVSDMAFGHDPAVTAYPYDPARAKQLLAEAGYPNGFEVTLNTYAGSIVSVEQVADAIQGQLARVGIRVKRKHFGDVGQFSKTDREGKLDGLTLSSWGSGSIFDADALFFPLARSGETGSYIADSELDGWIDGARATLDAAKRRELYTKIQQRIKDQAYVVAMYGQFGIEAVNKRLVYEATSDEIMHVYLAKLKE
jgi:peptide/nickel transport system substrate-binding protein